MGLTRRHFHHLLAGTAGALTAPWVKAQSNRTLRILVGFPPGGGSDAVARLLAERLRDVLAQNVIVENKPGAGGQIAAQALKASLPDGNTLFLSHDHSISILPLVTPHPGYAPEQDFVTVAGCATFVNAFALSGGTPAHSFAEYVQWVQQSGQGKGSVGVPAPASVPAFLVKLIGEKFKLDLVAAPYRGSAPLLADMLGNQIAAGVASVPDFIENHRAGKMRVVAVLGGERQAALPEVPTFRELGLSGFEDLPYYGLFAVKGTPAERIARISAAVKQALSENALRSTLTQMGLTVDYMSPQQLAQREQAYTQTWAHIIQTRGFVRP